MDKDTPRPDMGDLTDYDMFDPRAPEYRDEPYVKPYPWWARFLIWTVMVVGCVTIWSLLINAIIVWVRG